MAEEDINIRELLIRNGWKIEESRENIYLQNSVNKLEAENRALKNENYVLSKERDDLARRHALLDQQNTLYRSRLNVFEGKLSQSGEDNNRLMQEKNKFLEEYSLEKKQLQENCLRQQNEIDRLKKQIESLIQSNATPGGAVFLAEPPRTPRHSVRQVDSNGDQTPCKARRSKISRGSSRDGVILPAVRTIKKPEFFTISSSPDPIESAYIPDTPESGICTNSPSKSDFFESKANLVQPSSSSHIHNICRIESPMKDEIFPSPKFTIDTDSTVRIEHNKSPTEDENYPTPPPPRKSIYAPNTPKDRLRSKNQLKDDIFPSTKAQPFPGTPNRIQRNKSPKVPKPSYQVPTATITPIFLNESSNEMKFSKKAELPALPRRNTVLRARNVNTANVPTRGDSFLPSPPKDARRDPAFKHPSRHSRPASFTNDHSLILGDEDPTPRPNRISSRHRLVTHPPRTSFSSTTQRRYSQF
ncbi:uncharacterized protein [Clytia hemisphaerica]|uniref:Uncharacterized protein n=1 Tax=Clytia hemisphaerica TaxID=252671 RepID=A0A7M5XK89_9CNID